MLVWAVLSVRLVAGWLVAFWLIVLIMIVACLWLNWLLLRDFLFGWLCFLFLVYCAGCGWVVGVCRCLCLPCFVWVCSLFALLSLVFWVLILVWMGVYGCLLLNSVGCILLCISTLLICVCVIVVFNCVVIVLWLFFVYCCWFVGCLLCLIWWIIVGYLLRWFIAFLIVACWLECLF